MEPSSTGTKLCEVCSKVDIQCLIRTLHPCRQPLPCFSPTIEHIHDQGMTLGSIDEIKRRRSTCDICSLIAESLDEEPSDLDGECSLKECTAFCSFHLPTGIESRDPSVTHFHLTEASVMFDTSEVNRYRGPPFPWDQKSKDSRGSHPILNLQVKAGSGIEADTVSPHNEREFLSTIGGRYISTQANIPLMRAWLHQCEHEHGEKCTPHLQLAERARGPVFVIDVIDSRVVDTPPRCRYVTLSYVWGTAPVFVHVTDNTQYLLKPGSLLQFPIPATIRDAISLVHAIGERYLWVDSLCIIQDDWKMKGEEIMRMGSIYSGALFTIVAAAGDHANSGLPGVRQGTRSQTQKILKIAGCELLSVVDVRNTTSGIGYTTWGQRAWTFQERILSSKVLVFSDNQVYWSCRAATHSEDRALERARDVKMFQSPFTQLASADSVPWTHLDPSDYYTLYYSLLVTYRQRHLTYATDILNAFNGVSETLSALQKDAFFWGLPESLFSLAMTWTFTGEVTRNHIKVPILRSDGTKEMVPIPSWSWAAWSARDPHRLPAFHSRGTNARPSCHFHIVDNNRQLVRIKEHAWPGYPGDRDLSVPWKDEEPDPSPPHVPHPPLRVGQLRFWTSFANVKTILFRWDLERPGGEYSLCPPPDIESFQSNPCNEIVHQDFIVIAVYPHDVDALVVWAIEWKDGVAYRIGDATVSQTDWNGLENRQWRLITLG